MKNVLNSPRFQKIKKERNKILRKKIFFLLFLLVLILVGLSFLSKWDKLNINNIEITGNKVIETKMIEDVVKEKIAGNYLYFFPKTNFLLYPKGEIIKELTNKFTRLKNISLSIKNFQTLDISVAERMTLYTYCGDAPAEADLSISSDNTVPTQKCYFLDQDGYIFDEAPYFSGEVYLKFYGTVNNGDPLNIPSGSYFYQSIFSKLISFKDTLEKIGVKPAAFYVQDNGDIEVYLSSSVKSQLGPKIILKTDSDFDQVAENLQSVLTTEPFQSDFKNKYSSLLYIDLRFGNKVYYKFK